jgi:hypothetical protein
VQAASAAVVASLVLCCSYAEFGVFFLGGKQKRQFGERRNINSNKRFSPSFGL